MTDVVHVEGTTFRFETLPNDTSESVTTVLTENREKILAAARKVRKSKAAKRTERVSLATTRLPAPAGTTVTVYGERTATVSLPGPVASSVWATDDQTGQWLCLRARGGRWYEDSEHTSRVADARRAVVEQAFDVEERYKAVYRELSAEDSRAWYEATVYGKPDTTGVVRRVLGMRTADRVHNLWTLWHKLYPAVPFDFECVVTPTSSARYGDAEGQHSIRPYGQAA